MGRPSNASKPGHAITKALETPLPIPAQLAFGMMLKLTKNPRAFIKSAYQRCERELESIPGFNVSEGRVDHVALLSAF